MNNILLESLAQQINENSSTSAAEFAPMILPLVKKLYLDSLVAQIADVVPLKAPTGKIPALFSVYSGSGSSAETHTHPDSSFLIVVTSNTNPTSTWITDTATDTIGTSDFILRYIEFEEKPTGTFVIRALISRETGTDIPAVSDTFLGESITYTTYNRAAIKKLFRKYSGAYTYGDDSNVAVKHIGFEVRTEDVRTKSRKLRSKFSQEQLQDWLAIYKEKGFELAGESIANEIRQEIDKEFISYLKFIASLSLPSTMPNFSSHDVLTGLPSNIVGAANTLNLAASYGADQSGSLADVSYDLVANIYLAAEQIVKNTKRNRTVFVMADPVTCAFLQTNAFHVAATPEQNNPYRVGTLGIYPLFCDLFAETNEHYILVGYQTSTDVPDGDAGVFYAPYSTTIHTATDTNMKEHMLYLDRYALARHPQDVGNINKDDIWDSSNAGNSDFFMMFLVEYGNLKNFGNNSGVGNFK